MNGSMHLNLLGRRRAAWPGLSALALAAALAAWQGWLAWTDATRLREQQSALAGMRRPAATAGDRMSPAEIARHAQIEALARRLALPWSPLLDLFEGHARRGITLTRFVPDADSGRLEIDGRAAGIADLKAYLLALEADTRLADVALRSHEAQADAADGAVAFTIAARWGGAAPQEARR